MHLMILYTWKYCMQLLHKDMRGACHHYRHKSSYNMGQLPISNLGLHPAALKTSKQSVVWLKPYSPMT